jgi:mannitol-1-/sugar-/sorbitol-6-phosphatase
MIVHALECEAVLFDMDGTLVDSRLLVERIWLIWAAEHGIEPETVLAVAHGRRTLETMQLVAPHLATPEEAERLDALEETMEGDETATPGAVDLLTALELVGLPAPALLVAADDVKAGKPAPDGYAQAARLLQVPPHRCVVFEDTPAGVQAGRAAGCRVVGLLTTFPELEGCDYVVPDLSSVRVDGGPGSTAIRLALGGV